MSGRNYDFVTMFTLFLLFLIFLMKSELVGNDVHYVISNFDNQKYLVRQMDDDEDAADMLAKIKASLMKLVQHLREKYGDQPRVQQLIGRFNPHNIVENDGNGKYTSYSVNKGEKMVLCLRYRDGTNRLVDINTIMFVTLHELAHVMTKSVGHTEEFWANFKWLLQQSVQMGIYKCVDYETSPQKYCGIEVNNSPLKCSELYE